MIDDVKCTNSLYRINASFNLFREQPVINTSTLSVDYLGGLPDNTFGKEYWRFLDKNVSLSVVYFRFTLL